MLITAILGLIFFLLIIYFFPSPAVPFEKLYSKVPVVQRSSLETFRSQSDLRRININGIEWAYLTSGAGAKTVVFLHGMGGAYDIWWQQINHFKTSCRVISMTYPPVESLAGLSAGILGILDMERVEKAHIVGSSLGGYFAQYLVKNYPERIEKAVFANTFPPNPIIAEKVRNTRKILPLLPEWVIMRNLRKTTATSIYPASGNSDLVRAYMMEQSHGMMGKAQFVARFKCLLDDFNPPDPAALNIPTLIVESDNDPLVENQLRKMLKATYPSVPVVTFRQKGHFPYLCAPDEYNRILEQFIGI